MTPTFVMYVGASMVGVRRFAGHQTLPYQYTDDDYIELFPCFSEDELRELEGHLIRELKPRLNKFVPTDANSMTKRDIMLIPCPTPPIAPFKRIYHGRPRRVNT